MLFMLRRPRTPRRWTPFAAAVLAVGAASEAHAISGVCPDGSVFVVQRAADIPCSRARTVEPSDVPPLRPENLPRPYLWQVYQEKQNENNPYNLLERAERVRGGLGQGAAPPPSAPGAAPQPPPEPNATPQVAAAPPTAPPPQRADLGLTDGELRDLFVLVELSQKGVPATFVEEAGGAEAIRVSFAHSAAFEQRVRNATGVDGTVLLFSVQPSQRQRFQPNFTFVQGQTAFRPQPGRERELDVLVGSISGDLAPEQLVLGYAVLPSTIDASHPVDLYWDDRRLAATFR